MQTNIPKTLNVDAFEMRITDIADIDVSQLQVLSMAVGWPHRAPDWQHVLDVGHGFVALDQIGRVSASTMWFPHGENFATLGMLITSPRLQTNGTAKWLMERILEECAGRHIRLNSTRAARRLYLTFGFLAQRNVFQCQGEARMPTAIAELGSGLALRRLDRADLDAVIALDTPAFGAERRGHLVRLFGSSICYGLYDGDRLLAYSMRRRFGRGHVVGPVIAFSDEDAIAVTHPHIVAHAGSFLRIDLRFADGDFANFVQQSGMSVYDTVTTMVTHEAANYGVGSADEPVVYALASQSLG